MPEPAKAADARFAQNETDLFDELVAAKEPHLPKPHTLETQQYAFSTLEQKIRIDLYVGYGNDQIIYEGKKDHTTPKDIYQLRMYWDGLVYDGLRPTKAILISASHPDSVKAIIAEINKMTDATGRHYSFTTETWKDEGVSYPR